MDNEKICAVLEKLADFNEKYLETIKEFPPVRCPKASYTHRDTQDDWCDRVHVPKLDSSTFRSISAILYHGQASPGDLAAWRCAELRTQGTPSEIIVRTDDGHILQVGVLWKDDANNDHIEWFS